MFALVWSKQKDQNYYEILSLFVHHIKMFSMGVYKSLSWISGEHFSRTLGLLFKCQTNYFEEEKVNNCQL
jgi:hypothetical protein